LQHRNKYIIMKQIVLAAFFACGFIFQGIGQISTKASFEKEHTNNYPSKSALSGYVVDNKGAGLLGAVVLIHDIKISVTTDKNGYFITSKFPTGKYLVEITFIGYSSHIETIDLTNDFSGKFILEESVAEHEGVTVTGVASAVKLKQSAQPVSIVKKSDLLQTTSTNIIDALGKKVTGFSSISTGPAISKPVIRGLGYNRVVVINDGVRQEGQQWGDEHGIEIDENSVQKVEVIKGPASLMYGSDAMAGVINLLTNTPTEQGTIKGNFGYSFLDNNGMHNVNGNITGHLKNGFNFNAYGTYKTAKDYENKYDGKVFNSRFNERNFGGYIGINKSWGFTHLLVSNFDQKTGLVEGERDATTGKFLIFGGSIDEREATSNELNSRTLYTPYQHIQHFKISSDNSISLGKSRLTVNLGFQRNQRKEFGDYTQPNTPALYFDLKTITYNVQYHLPNSNGWKTTIGINGMQQQNENKAEEVLIPEYQQFDAGLFVYSKKTINKLTVSGGLRADFRNLNSKELYDGSDIKFASIKNNYTNISGSIGIAYEANKQTTLRLNFARGYRAPTIAELGTNGIHEGTNRYEYGDNKLTTETSFQIDAGFDYNTEHFNLSLNGFLNNINNFIYYRKLAAVNGGDSIVLTPYGPATAFKFSQANAALYGFEMKLDIHPHPLDWLHFENNFSLVAGTFGQSIEGTNHLPFIPAPRWQSELRGDFKKLSKALKNVYVKLEMDNVSTQNKIFSAYNTETATQGYTLFNIGAGTDVFGKKNKLASIYLSLNNLTDMAYQNHLSRLKYTAENMTTGRTGVFNMGRNFNCKIVMPINFVQR
jgi:iron complex outermembrane receptor protein